MPGWKRSRSVLPRASRPRAPLSPSGTRATEPISAALGGKQKLALRVARLAAARLAAGEQGLEGFEVAHPRRPPCARSAAASDRVRLADEHQHGVEGVEVLAQARFELLDGAVARLRAQQPPREAVQLLGDGIVGARHGARSPPASVLERRLPLAQHLDLALHEGDGGAAARVRQPQPRQHRQVVLEEFRILLQIMATVSSSAPLRLDSASLCVAHCAVVTSFNVTFEGYLGRTASARSAPPAPASLRCNSPPRVGTRTLAVQQPALPPDRPPPRKRRCRSCQVSPAPRS